MLVRTQLGIADWKHGRQAIADRLLDADARV